MTPLRPAELHVLLALAHEPLHGYALVHEIEEQSDGRVQMLPGNLYAVIHRLVADGLVRPSRSHPRPEEDQRRRYFELTPSGSRALRAEKEHYERLIGRMNSLSFGSGRDR